MPDTAGSAGSVNDARSGLALVVALDVERAVLARIHRRLGLAAQLPILQSGQGSTHARRTAGEALNAGARALLCIGLAGGLAADVASGDIIVARRVVDETGAAWSCDAAWVDAIVRRLGGRVHAGTLLSAATVIGTPAAKAAAAARYGALACDMEAAAIARVAAESGVPFVAVRVISDGPQDALPSRVEDWVDDRGGSRIAPVLGALADPRQWRPLLVLIRGYRTASASLARVAAELAPAQYGRQEAR
jgi:nucleoside phosphorylase